ncbi:MAG: hypothetical protein A2W22_03910 [Candidatus Levybacteria bacterium RBG_16_35_11]|nr:MAG: hypothetical protein A2W22_03910 [Candidatus Levybacteria bacterium RBG_16_35_11]
MKKTRRSRRLEKKTKRNIILTLLGIAVVFIFIVKLGIPLMANFALFVSGFRTGPETKAKDNLFIQPPILNSIPFATNSAQLEISGKAIKNGTLQLFINDQLVNSEIVNEDGNFKFIQTLDSGENQIKTKVEINGRKSDFSDIFTVVYKSSAPSITIDVPADGEEFSKEQKTANVAGKVDSGTTVTVNGFWAIVDESNTYSYSLPLKNGENEIIVVATDQAGNKAEKTIKVKYSE